MFTAQEAFDFYGKKLNEEERLAYIFSKIMSVCQDETSLKIPFLGWNQIRVLKEKGYTVKDCTEYFVISWDMESWKDW